MRAETSNHGRHTLLKSKLVIVSVTSLVLVAVPSSCRRSIPHDSPPNLSGCTQLEVRYYPSTLDYFLGAYHLEHLLNSQERAYLASSESFRVTDQACIAAFGHDIDLGTYSGFVRGNAISYATPVAITGYRDGERYISFTVLGSDILTEDRRRFSYPLGSPNLQIVEPYNVLALRSRGLCGLNLERLYTAGSLTGKAIFGRNVAAYPDPNGWCDTISAALQSLHYVNENGIKRRSYSEERISAIFACPGLADDAHKQRSPEEPAKANSVYPQPVPPQSHYAMNPDCGPNSAPETVLLFESKPSWNQHGGPELFTFDNHDPKGGLVLLNDGTVKFIRTEEELRQLRWK